MNIWLCQLERDVGLPFEAEAGFGSGKYEAWLRTMTMLGSRRSSGESIASAGH